MTLRFSELVIAQRAGFRRCDAPVHTRRNPGRVGAQVIGSDRPWLPACGPQQVAGISNEVRTS